MPARAAEPRHSEPHPAGTVLECAPPWRDALDEDGFAGGTESRAGDATQPSRKKNSRCREMLASARYELRLAALPPDALIAITAGAMRDSPAANRRAEALLAHHSPPPAVATDVLADPDLAPCVLEKTGLRHAAVCKRWSLICAPRGAFARLVESAGDASACCRLL